MTGAGLLLALLLAAGQHEVQPSPAHEPAASQPAHEAAPAGQEVAPATAHAPEGEHAAAPAEHEGEDHGPAAVLMHHVLDQEFFGIPSKYMVYFVLASLLVLLVTRLAIRGYRDGVPSGLASAVEALVLFVRDDIAETNIGHDGRRFVPLLLSFFFFILIAALLGLTPFAATSTANLSVTLGLAFISFLAQQWAGISKYGVVKHFTGMVPHGLPWPLVIIMIPVEILGMFSKPFALMIRLFANMLAGHMVITTLLMLVPLMAVVSTALGVAMLPVSLGLSLFIMILEVLVAFIQAYIFTLLTSIFIGMYAHPAH
ncbi:MAG TPA: F0F1 ATP synthase subunit A [Vicinamibacteria bacterium]|nr:F0F1 ATP synthase subunit A [Vicinamibacteria bacterium]